MPRQLPTDFFKRIEDGDDEVFYSAPRRVVHLDDGAIAKAGGIVIDNLNRAARSYLARGDPGPDEQLYGERRV